MKYCPECGAAIRPGTRFCVKCGFHIESFVVPEERKEENAIINETMGSEYCPDPAPSVSEKPAEVSGMAYGSVVTNAETVTPESAVSKKSYKKWLFAGIGALLVVVLVAIFVLTSGGGLDKDESIRYNVHNLVGYVPSDWEYYDGDFDYECASYIKNYDDGYVFCGVMYMGSYDPDEFVDLRANYESNAQYEVSNYSVRGADDSFLAINDEGDNITRYYLIFWEDECYVVILGSKYDHDDERLFDRILKSLEYHG